MARKKNLERAIVLGLLLSTSVYSNVLAEKTYTIEEFRDLGNEISIEENTIVNGTGTSIGGDEVNNTISGKVITVGDGVNFTLNNLAGNHMNIKGNGNININLDHDAGANGGAIYINGNITANKLTIDTSKTPNTKGIYTYGGDVVLDINELDIKANSHGIFTTGDATSDVIINDTDKVSITTDGAHGIVNSGNASHVNNIIIKSDRENSLVDIFSHTAGISNNNSGGGVIDIKADTISIGTDNLYAVRGDHGDIILNAKNNTISGGTSGVHTLNGDIKITAEEGNQIATTNNKDVTLGAIYTSTDKEGNPGNGTIEIIAKNGNNKVNAVTDGVHTKGNGTVDLIANGYNSIISDKNAVYNNGTNTINIKAVASENDNPSTLADYNDYDNVLIAGENGIKSDFTGTTNVIADNNNYIAGTTNGILSDGAGTITVTAGNDNIIGQYTYKDENNSDVIVTSNTCINITEGTVDIDANTGNNIIYAKNTGIDVSKGKADLDAYGNNIISINSNSLNSSGISVIDNGQVEISSKNGSIGIDVTTNFKQTLGTYETYGIRAKNSSVTLDAFKDVSIKLNINENITGTSGKMTSALTADENSEATLKVGGFLYLESKGNKTGHQGNNDVRNYGIQAVNGSKVDITVNGKNEYGYGTVISTEGRYSTAISSEDSSTELKLIDGGIYIENTAQDDAYSVHNLASADNSTVNISANGDIYLGSTNNSPVDTGYYTGPAYVKGIVNESNDVNDASTIVSADTVIIESIANGENNSLQAYGIQASNTGTGNNLIDIDSENLSIDAKVDRKNKVNYAYGINSQNSTIDIDVTSSTDIESSQYGIFARNYYTQNNTETNIDIDSGLSNTITATNTGIYSNGLNTTVKLNAKQNTINANTGIWGLSKGKVSLDATTLTNEITADAYGIYADTQSDIDLNAGNSNNILAAKTTITDKETGNSVDYGQQSAVYALSGSSVDLAAGEQNYLLGAVYANGSGTNVDVKGKNGSTATNVVRSAAVIDNAGGLTGKTTVDNETTGMDVVSALYAEEGASINLSGVNDIQTYYVDPNDKHTSERAVWAYKGADITIDGNTNISTSSYESSPNDMDIAIAAGTATGLDKDDFDDEVLGNLDIANVTLNYENNGESKSSITGDILSAYGGVVDIKAKEGVGRAVSDAGINIHGNLLAGNTGVLNVDIGKGSTLTGRADDYGDAGVEGTTHGAGEDTANSFFNPAFSSEIITGGEVNLTMGEGSVWNVTGQSWITSLTTTGNAEDTLISLKNAKEDLNSNASALTIGTLKGDTRFYMNLDGDRSASDMLYIKNADGKYDIYLQEEVLSSEINSDKAGNAFNGLRFATVGEGNAEFTVRSQGTGSAFDVEYEVGTDSYENNSENTAYNSTGGGEGNVEKPGNASVDDFFGLNDTSSQANAENNIMLMAETDEAIDTAANSAENSTLDEVTNFKIVKRLGEELNDTGKTILNMSRANYSNAIYMDRLNKRLGEARYINSEEDEGMWVRIRHDRIGKDDAYRSQNTMYELGYDQKQECDNGERRVGMAIDYMHGDTGYNDIAGKGEIDRYGLWLYDTWMGDKGHYADYVAKWGHLSNDFEVYTMQNGDKVTGDYSNNVFSVSAEYGRKKDIGNDWYFEPQVQAQLARVTGADYTTNQGTKVSVDGINSLIGRAGFRLGKDFGEEKQSTVYIKADVLHEFLGDQDVRVLDKSSDNKWAGISYENEGTWYDVGFGFATQMSKNSYAFMDFEKSFGNDNDETYQINVGMQWSF